MMNFLKNKSIEVGVISGLISFFVIFLITFLIQLGGINLLEFILLPFISGLILFIVIVICFSVFFKKYFIEKTEKGIVVNKFKLISIGLIFVLITYFAFDYIFFLFDDSLSIDYYNKLRDFIISENGNISDLNGFSGLPFGIQNVFTNIFFAIVGSLFSLVFIKNKKDKNDRF